MRQGRGRRKLSASVLTPLWRLLGAAMWAAAAWFVVLLVVSLAWDLLLASCVLSPILGLMGWHLLRLKTVWAAEHELEIRGLFNRAAVPYSQVAEVRYSRWLPTTPIRLLFKDPTPFGISIHYTCSPALAAWMGHTPEDVLFLRGKIAAAMENEKAS